MVTGAVVEAHLEVHEWVTGVHRDGGEDLHLGVAMSAEGIGAGGPLVGACHLDGGPQRTPLHQPDLDLLGGVHHGVVGRGAPVVGVPGVAVVHQGTKAGDVVKVEQACCGVNAHRHHPVGEPEPVGAVEGGCGLGWRGGLEEPPTKAGHLVGPHQCLVAGAVVLDDAHLPGGVGGQAGEGVSDGEHLTSGDGFAVPAGVGGNDALCVGADEFDVGEGTVPGQHHAQHLCSGTGSQRVGGLLAPELGHHLGAGCGVAPGNGHCHHAGTGARRGVGHHRAFPSEARRQVGHGPVCHSGSEAAGLGVADTNGVTYLIE